MTINAQTLFDGGVILLLIVGAIATAFNSRSAKKSSDETDALTTIKIKDLTIETLQKENKDLNERMAKQGERIAVLESENKRMSAIIENRNPELEVFISTASKSLESIIETNKTILDAIHVLLKPIK